MPIKPILIAAVFIGIIVHALIFRKREDVPVGKSSRPKREIWEVIILFAIILAGNSIINYLSYCVENTNEMLVDILFWGQLALILTLLLLFIFVLEKRKLKDVGFQKPVNHAVWVSGVGLFIIWIAAMWSKSNLTFLTFLFLIREPILEEIIFRGFFQTNLERVLGSRRGFWMAVILFTAFHIPSYFWGWQAHHELGSLPEKFVRLAASFLLAVFFSMIYRKTRSLYPLFGIHLLANGHLANLYYLIF